MHAFAWQLRLIDYLNSGRIKTIYFIAREDRQTQVSGEGSPCKVTEEPLERKVQ